MKTLWDYKDVINFKEVLTKEQRNLLLTTKDFENFEIDDDKKEIIYDALSKTEFSIYEDSLEIIKKLKSDGFKLCIVSNVYCITSDKLRKLFRDFLDYFDVITFSSEVGIRKPNNDIFNFTLNKLNEINIDKIFPTEVVMIGDSEEKDIIPALNLGMRAILIDRENQNLKEIIL